MLCWIAILGGLLVMMGQHSRSESLFYYFRLEDHLPENHLPENHLLRLIDRHVSFDFVRAKLKDSYSEMGRPSIDPELLLRILLVGYLYGVSSERKLVEELRMHLAWRWFTGLGFDQEIPHHSTFSKNRHGRFHESNLFEQLFEEIVARCLEAWLVQGDHLSVDGSFIQADASTSSRIPREQLAEAAQVKRTGREYLADLEQENAPTDEPLPQQERVSTTDPVGSYVWRSRTRMHAAATNTASIAVLPFADMSAGKDQEYFSDGLAEELTNELAKVPGLKVAGRSSAFQFKGRNEDPRTVGRTLNVAN